MCTIHIVFYLVIPKNYFYIYTKIHVQVWSQYWFCLFCFVFCFVLAAPHGLQDLSSPTRDLTRAPLQWKPGVLATGLPGNSHSIVLFVCLFFKTYLFILFIFGCVRSQLRHAGSLLRHEGCFVAARRLLSSCSVQVFSSLVVAHRLQGGWALQFAAHRLSS